MKAYERFLDYVSYDTQSDEYSTTCPSTKKQLILAKALYEELRALGLEATYNENGNVMATIPSNMDTSTLTVGFIAHIDTAMEMPGKDVKPRIIKSYNGEDIILNDEKNIILSPKQFNNLLSHIGEDLIVTDGTTLLGGDDKAGVAEIMTMAEYFVNHKEVKHGKIMIAFTPDEEVGRGTENFDLKAFNATFAYTVDGGKAGEIEYENFNAASCIATFNGKSIHPGSAKNKMVNATSLAMEFDRLLPPMMRPEYTEGYEGFYHLNEIEGSVASAKSHYLIRNHDKQSFDNQKEILKKNALYMNEKWGYEAVTLKIKDSYENMAGYLSDKMYVIDIAKKAMEELGIKATTNPIRGGTDGARLTAMGLPCPNLGTGDENPHGAFEYVSINQMDQMVDILIKIALLVSKM